MTDLNQRRVAGRKLQWIDDHRALLADELRLQQVRDDIAAGDIYIARRQFDAAVLQDIRDTSKASVVDRCRTTRRLRRALRTFTA